jgi:ADP-L-glycero-D-manno-heptose 6-epimerase
MAGLFNCGTGQGHTWLDLARAVGGALGREPRIRFIDMPEELRPRYQYYTVADLRKLRAAGYGAAFTSLEDGVYTCVHAGMTGAEDHV